MFTLPELPYAEDALAPHISAETMKFHYGKHHKGYVETLNTLLADDVLKNASLPEVIRETYDIPARKKVFNNAAQCWNHAFFWQSMRPGGGGLPTGDLKVLIEHDIGDDDAFAKVFTDAAIAHFGSGWIWLVVSDGVVGIITTHDADLPIVHGRAPLICCDLWEHAYYLDYQNRRADFVKTFLNHLVNWDFANANMTKAAAATHEVVAPAMEPNREPLVMPSS